MCVFYIIFYDIYILYICTQKKALCVLNVKLIHLNWIHVHV